MHEGVGAIPLAYNEEVLTLSRDQNGFLAWILTPKKSWINLFGLLCRFEKPRVIRLPPGTRLKISDPAHPSELMTVCSPKDHFHTACVEFDNGNLVPLCRLVGMKVIVASIGGSETKDQAEQYSIPSDSKLRLSALDEKFLRTLSIEVD